MPVSGPDLIRRWAPTRWTLPLPPAPAWPRLSIDVSNYQRDLDDHFFERWTRQGFGGLIVQAVTGFDGVSYTVRQIQAALDHDWQVGAYAWCAQGDGMRDYDFRRRLELLERFLEPLEFLALDVEEQGLAPEDVDADLLHCDALIDDAPLYTGHWVFEKAGWLHETYWADRRLWDSNFDQVADVDVGFRAYGGWTEAWLKQYTDDPLDLNVCGGS